MSEGDGGEEGGDAGGCCGGARFSRGGDDGMPECRPANSTRRACVGATCWSSEFALSANAPSRAAATSNSHDVFIAPRDHERERRCRTCIKTKGGLSVEISEK